MQSSDLGVFFLSCVSFAVLVGFIARFRKTTFAKLDSRDLAIKDPFWSNLYGLAIFIVLGIMLFDLLSVLQTSCWFNDIYSQCGNSHYFESIWFSRMNNNLLWYYLFALFIPIMWTTWTLIVEIDISKRMREARTDLLLGNIDGVSTKESTQSMVVEAPTSLQKVVEAPTSLQNDEPATFEEVLQAMEAELERAIDSAKQLKQELDETKEKVETLEVEVQEKDLEIQQIKESKTNFDKLISEKSDSEDNDSKSLSLTDSVMVGDFLMGIKIDKQISNDLKQTEHMHIKWERVIQSRVYRHKRETKQHTICQNHCRILATSALMVH